MYKRFLHKMIMTGVFAGLLFLAACSTPEAEVSKEAEGGFVKIAPGAYDSADRAVVVSKKEELGQITFFNLQKKKKYTLKYDGTTKFMDKYGSQISAGQLKEGEVAELYFLKDEKALSSLEVSSEIWTLDEVSEFELDLNAGRMKILEDYYTLDEDTIVVSDGEQRELIDLNAQDVLEIKGEGHKIYSIIVQEGHGYLRLSDDEYFIGGWIEVGQKIIEKIESNMLLAVPEGDYEVYLSHGGIEGTKEVKIRRNKETVLDVGDLKKDDLIKYGNLIFTVDPSEAEVYIDGKKTDITRVVKAEYGLHQIMVKAEGYETVIQYIRVNETNANVSISLDEETQHTVSGNTISNNTVSDTSKKENSSKTETADKKEESADNKKEDKKEDKKTSSTSTQVSGNTSGAYIAGYKIMIAAPEGAEIYVDGSYVGIAPVSYKKKSGTQEITVRKNGYVTRKYTINVDDEQKDVSYSFSELEPSK